MNIFFVGFCSKFETFFVHKADLISITGTSMAWSARMTFLKHPRPQACVAYAFYDDSELELLSEMEALTVTLKEVPDEKLNEFSTFVKQSIPSDVTVFVGSLKAS